MALIKNVEKYGIGEELIGLINTANSSIDSLLVVRSGLIDMKNTINNDPYYDVEEASEVQDTIDAILSRIRTDILGE